MKHAICILVCLSFFLAGCVSNEIIIGAVSDIEGAIENAYEAAGHLQDADLIIMAGDVYENEEMRTNPLYPESTNNKMEMIEGIKPFAELGVPIYIIPGNHEKRGIYNSAISELQETYPNVIDLNNRMARYGKISIIGVGGYHDARFIDKEGFKIDYDSLSQLVNELNGPAILITHGPPKSNGKIDYVPGIGHVGDEMIKSIIKGKRILHIHGHIHEGGGNEENDGNLISANVASVTGYNSNPGITIIRYGNWISGISRISLSEAGG